MEDKIFQKAFNAGYMLEKYVSTLSQLLIKNFQDSENDFFAGFQAGSQQFIGERDKKKSRLITKLQRLSEHPPKSSTKLKDKGFDKEK